MIWEFLKTKQCVLDAKRIHKNMREIELDRILIYCNMITSV